MAQDSDAPANALGEATAALRNAFTATLPKIRCAFSACQIEFQPTRKWQKFCCVDHRNKHFWSTHVRATLSKDVIAAAVSSEDTTKPTAPN